MATDICKRVKRPVFPAVEIIQPRYWVFEDIIQVLNYLPDGTPYQKIDSSQYSPQARKRAYVGKFPKPAKGHDNRTLKDCLLTGASFMPTKIYKNSPNKDRGAWYSKGTYRQVFLNKKCPTIATGTKDFGQHVIHFEDGRAWTERLNGFLNLHGHRAAREFDLYCPRWRENPSFVLQMVKNYLAHESSSQSPPEHFKEQMRERETYAKEMIRRLSSKTFDRLIPVRRLIMKKAYNLACRYLPLRESPKYYYLMNFAIVRNIYLEIGRRLVERGLIEKNDDVFFLSRPELEKALSGQLGDREKIRKMIRDRYEEWERYCAASTPPLIRSDGKPINVKSSMIEEGVFQGTPVSPGVVEGRARIILDPTLSSEMTQGEILVAPVTDPGWTPLFLTAAGLVMEVGGAVSHGAIVAREYGIPAVVGVRDATSLIKTGETIRVDGNEGRVYKLKIAKN